MATSLVSPRQHIDPEVDNVYTLRMDVLFQYQGLEFVWNIHKAAANLAKHGVRFEKACQAFLDPLAQLADASVEDETRDAVVGATEDGTLLFVVHIEREDDSIRIISARFATTAERKIYEDHP